MSESDRFYNIGLAIGYINSDPIKSELKEEFGIDTAKVASDIYRLIIKAGEELEGDEAEKERAEEHDRDQKESPEASAQESDQSD